MKNSVASELQSLFFQLGLNFDQELYTFLMVNTSQAQKQTSELAKMIIALVDCI